MQYTFLSIFLKKDIDDSCNICAQNINCGNTLEPKANLCFFLSNIRKKCKPCKPHFYCMKVGYKELHIIRTCKRDATLRRHVHLRKFEFSSITPQKIDIAYANSTLTM